MPHSHLSRPIGFAALLIIPLALTLAGCASSAAMGSAATISTPTATSAPATTADAADAAAHEQAQEWLEAANLPPGAVRSSVSTGRFNSYTGWPCGPTARLEGFWTIPHTTVSNTANWLREHPTAHLITTAVGPVPNDPTIDSAIVGYIPRPGAQEGIVYTIAKTNDGVAVRAEIAALTKSAVCPTPPGGGTWGAPGQG